MDMLAAIADTLPAMQRSISILHEKECASLGIPCTEVQCVVDVNVERGMRIEPGSCPVVRVSAVWAFDCIIQNRSELIISALRRAIRVAHTKLRWTLGNNKPRFAAEYVEKARAFRLTHPDTFSLPIKAFRTRLTVTMTDAMTGEVEVRENVRLSELQDVQKELAHLLTARVYAHEQIADLLDMLEGHKLAVEEPSPIAAAEVIELGNNHTLITYTYADAS